MVGIQTRLALKRRALSAAGWLEYWAERLQDEMEKQDVELVPKKWFDALKADNSKTVTLTRGDMRELIRGMWEQRDELRRFAK
jgi:hypothetical protein